MGLQREEEHTVGDGDASRHGKAKERAGQLCGALALPKSAGASSFPTPLKYEMEILSLSTRSKQCLSGHYPVLQPKKR